MDELYASPRPRITVSLLPKFIGKYVTMMGTIAPGGISADGNSFKLFDGESSVDVVLSAPLNEMLEDVVEVTGRVDNQCHLQCMTYRQLHSNVPFSLKDYKETVELIHKFPTCYSYEA